MEWLEVVEMEVGRTENDGIVMATMDVVILLVRMARHVAPHACSWRLWWHSQV